MKHKITLITATLLATVMLTVTGCGGSDPEPIVIQPILTTPANPVTPAPVVNSSVQYEGTTLVVFGNSYYRVAQDPKARFASEQIIVGAIDGKETELLNLLGQFSIDVIRQLGTGVFLVKVPSGFEEQWVRALSDQASVRYSETDAIVTTQ